MEENKAFEGVDLDDFNFDELSDVLGSDTEEFDLSNLSADDVVVQDVADENSEDSEGLVSEGLDEVLADDSEQSSDVINTDLENSELPEFLPEEETENLPDNEDVQSEAGNIPDLDDSLSDINEDVADIFDEQPVEENLSSEETEISADIEDEARVTDADVFDDFSADANVEDQSLETEDVTFGNENLYDDNDRGNLEVEGIVEANNCGYLKWYSGSASDDVFEFGKDSESGSFEANENCKAIHVNVGYDTYGWEVQFTDGVIMNLRDVREYQIRNGKLPCPDGRIVYGKLFLSFYNVERILVYERVRYFSYGL